MVDIVDKAESGLQSFGSGLLNFASEWIWTPAKNFFNDWILGKHPVLRTSAILVTLTLIWAGIKSGILYGEWFKDKDNVNKEGAIVGLNLGYGYKGGFYAKKTSQGVAVGVDLSHGFKGMFLINYSKNSFGFGPRFTVNENLVDNTVNLTTTVLDKVNCLKTKVKTK